MVATSEPAFAHLIAQAETLAARRQEELKGVHLLAALGAVPGAIRDALEEHVDREPVGKSAREGEQPRHGDDVSMAGDCKSHERQSRCQYVGQCAFVHRGWVVGEKVRHGVGSGYVKVKENVEN